MERKHGSIPEYFHSLKLYINAKHHQEHSKCIFEVFKNQSCPVIFVPKFTYFIATISVFQFLG